MYMLRSILLATSAVAMLNACGTAETRPTPEARQTSPPVAAAPAEPSYLQKTQSPMTLADSIQVCKRVQQERHIPIVCLTTYVEGRPTMVVGFADASGFRTYGGAIVEYVAGPFCDAANQANREAFLVFSVERPGLATLYSCETGEMTEWFDPNALRRS